MRILKWAWETFCGYVIRIEMTNYIIKWQALMSALLKLLVLLPYNQFQVTRIKCFFKSKGLRLIICNYNSINLYAHNIKTWELNSKELFPCLLLFIINQLQKCYGICMFIHLLVTIASMKVQKSAVSYSKPVTSAA